MDQSGVFTEAWNDVAREVNWVNESHGFNDANPNKGEMIALMHSELSEALEALRHGDPQDSHCPQHKNLAVELADCVIRIMHFDSRFDVGVAAALIDKLQYNATRPFKHGKAF